MLTLKEFLLQQPSISYADDPIFYGDRPFEIKFNDERGILEAENKASWIKKDGKWLKPLKFLGLEYNGLENTLKAHTRNGATLEVKGDQAKMLEAIEE